MTKKKFKFGRIVKIGNYEAVVVRDYENHIEIVYNTKSDSQIYSIEKDKLEDGNL